MSYQTRAARTLVTEMPFAPNNTESLLTWNALGLAGEAGEVAELVKKGIYHRHGLDVAKVANEIGDVLWYCAAICTILGLDLDEIANANIAKLWERYPEGYSDAASIARVDVHP